VHGFLMDFSNGIQQDFHIRRCSCRLAVTQRMPHVEQELSTIPKYIPSVSEVPVARSLFCKVMFCRSLFVLLSFFAWPVYCLSLDLRPLATPLITFLAHIIPTCYTYIGRLDQYYDIYQCPHCPMLGL
jgi:hypothetical protein